MSFGNSVIVNQVSTATGQGVRILTQVGAICGYGSGSGDYGDKVPNQMRNLSEIKTQYGEDSAIYNAANLVSLNAGGLGEGLWVVQHESSAGVGDTQSGDASTKEFTVAGVVTQILKGSLVITVDAGAQTEGVDYVVDYSNDKVHFNTAPPVGVDNIVFAWREASVANITDALAELETKNINFVILAYIFDAPLLAELEDHIVDTESAGWFRLGFMSGKYLDATDIKSLATNNDNKRIGIFANRSGWKGTSNQNWLEFRDPAAIVMGLCMNPSVTPGVDLHEKEVRGYNLFGQFTLTEIGDELTPDSLIGKRINVFFASRWEGGSISIWKGYTNDQTKAVPFINKQRSYDYADFLLKARLTPFSGNVKIALRGDMEKVGGSIWFTAMQLYRERIINNPSELEFTYGVPVIDWELLRILRKPPADRTDAENSFVQAEETANETVINFNGDFLSGLHTIVLNLALLT